MASLTHMSHNPATLGGSDARAGVLSRFVEALKRSRQAAAEREVRRFVDSSAVARPTHGNRATFV